jgi:SNF2 family DNA or RNA helicase
MVTPSKSWRLTIHVQATEDPSRVVDAPDLWSEESDHPRILQRPFIDAREQLRSDLAYAARHFPPLSACAEPSGPLERSLTLDEAYRFLRDAVPVLELEGFGIWVPRWWGADRPRVGLQLDISPLESAGAVETPAMRLDTLVAYDWRIALGDDALSPEELKELAAAKAPLVRLRGRWTEVQPSDVEAALRFIEKNRGGKITVFEALRRCYFADDLESGLRAAGLRARGWIDRLLNATDVHDRVEPLGPPRQFRGTLRPYQLKGLEWLWFLTKHGLGACLADDMGLGKTIQLIALWLYEREAGGPTGPTLLVVPMSLVGNWQRETARFAPSLKVMVHHGLERLTGQGFVNEVAGYDVVVSTYGLTHRDYEHLAAVDWHRIALDEAQNIKNPAAKQSVAIRSLRATHRVALTGTPVENRLSELWSIMDFLNPSYMGRATDFRRRFAIPIERYHHQDRAERLRHLIRPFVLRRCKDDPEVIVDLPAKMEMKVFCNLTKEQAALYEAIINEMLGQIDRAGGIQRRGLILAALTKLKQICNHPAHFLADGSALAHRSGKCDRLAEMLEEVVAEGHNALVFTQFREMGTLLEKLLRESLDCEILFLHGGTSQKQRDEMVLRFQSNTGNTPVFILSLKAGGFGLNLTAATHVFHYDRWWNPAVEDQATDRAHRIGQEQQVQVHKFVCVGTLEERIDQLIERKRSLAENIVGTGEGWVTELSTNALRELFALSRDAVAED